MKFNEMLKKFDCFSKMDIDILINRVHPFIKRIKGQNAKRMYVNDYIKADIDLSEISTEEQLYLNSAWKFIRHGLFRYAEQESHPMRYFCSRMMYELVIKGYEVSVSLIENDTRIGIRTLRKSGNILSMVCLYQQRLIQDICATDNFIDCELRRIGGEFEKKITEDRKS